MTDDDLTDDQLLALPADSIPGGGLSQYFSRRSNALQSAQANEMWLELSGVSARNYMIFDAQDPKLKKREEDERAAAQRRLDNLLNDIVARQREIAVRKKEIEDRALMLRDGRKVFVDGDRFRDEFGYVLTGEDEKEARRLSAQHPGASTWQEYTEIQRQAEEAERLRQDALKARGGDTAQVSALEQDFKRQVDQRAEAPAVDYGTADYGDLLGEKEKAPQPSGQGALKP